MSRPQLAANCRWTLAFAVGALSLAGISALATAPNLSQALAASWITLVVICITLQVYRYTALRILLHLSLFAIPISVFYRVLYRGSISPGVMLSIGATTTREARELLGNHPLLTALLSFYVLLALWALIAASRSPGEVRSRTLLSTSMAALALMVTWFGSVLHQHGEWHNLNWALKDSAREIFPIDVILTSKIVALGEIRTARAESSRAQFSFPGVTRVDPTGAALPQICVVVIGESSRRDHWSLYGYGRPTTPKLEGLRDQLIVFDEVSSNATITMFSVTLALTRAEPNSWDIASRERSLVTLLRQGGYTVSWISNQEKFGFSENPVTSIAREADSVSFANDYVNDLRQAGSQDPLDTNLLVRLDRELQRVRQSGRDAFIFLHTMGSHEAYDQRYPRDFDVFHTALDALGRHNAKQARIVDTYDDSIRFTDYVLDSIIQKVAEQAERSAVIYFSDHGERLFESDQPMLSGHGFPQQSRAELEIPLLMWLSPQFREANAPSVRRLENNVHRSASLDALFETIVDLAGLTYSGRDADRSLFSAHFEPERTTRVLTMSQDSICVDNERPTPLDGRSHGDGALVPVPCSAPPNAH
ncbi:MAG: phosphoethanolamine transferase [Proteobacteria bacterium]|nr:phosphoethanolamine transferase [Pseudomonadota bacterium]